MVKPKWANGRISFLLKNRMTRAGPCHSWLILDRLTADREEMTRLGEVPREPSLKIETVKMYPLVRTNEKTANPSGEKRPERVFGVEKRRSFQQEGRELAVTD